jgi:hypothetical protein
MITLAFYKGTRRENPKAQWWDWLVCWWTKGRFSHCEIVIPGTRTGGRVTCASSSNRDGGVRTKRITLTTGRWVMVAMPHYENPAAIDWFDQHEDARYDWLGILGFVFPWIKDNPRRFYCSEACALALTASARASAPPDLPLTWPPAAISPQALYEWILDQPGAEVFEIPGLDA